MVRGTPNKKLAPNAISIVTAALLNRAEIANGPGCVLSKLQCAMANDYCDENLYPGKCSASRFITNIGKHLPLKPAGYL